MHKLVKTTITWDVPGQLAVLGEPREIIQQPGFSVFFTCLALRILSLNSGHSVLYGSRHVQSQKFYLDFHFLELHVKNGCPAHVHSFSTLRRNHVVIKLYWDRSRCGNLMLVVRLGHALLAGKRQLLLR